MNASVTLSPCKQDQTKKIISFSLTVFVETKNADFPSTLGEETINQSSNLIKFIVIREAWLPCCPSQKLMFKT